MSKIPVSVLVTTKNEEAGIERCLKALVDFDEVIVIDSHSSDKTAERSRAVGVDVVMFKWNGLYPKKRQWCLDTLKIRHNWVFWVDADEVLTPDMIEEIRDLFVCEPEYAGYFVKGRYVWNGKVLKHGLMNNKLALFDRRKMEFPVIDDLDIEGMGEIEGHYQPVLKQGCEQETIGQLKHPLLHYAYDDKEKWEKRHKQYAHWEASVTKRNVWPQDPVCTRQMLKNCTRTSALRPFVMFIYSYVIRLGFLDGVEGYHFALSRKKYCDMVGTELAGD